MSLAAPSSGGQVVPAGAEVVLRRRMSPERLYWRLQRPRAGVYARRIRLVLLYRAAAAAAAIITIASCAFLGMFLRVIGARGWLPPAPIGDRTISLAATQAVAGFAAWVPGFIVLGVVLAIIPRPRRWIFRITVLAAGALGYCRRFLPAFPRSSVTSAITGRTAAFAAQLALRPSATRAAAAAGLVMVAAVAAYIGYRYSYGFAARSTGLIPRRPVSHYRSAFAGLSVLQRLAVVPVSAALLLAVTWIAESIRAALPGVRYGGFLFGYSHPSELAWVIAALIIAWMLCMPRPNGSQWLFILLLLGLTAYAFAPHVYLIRMPAVIPAAGSGGFWALAIAYLAVTGFGYTLVASLLDWR